MAYKRKIENNSVELKTCTGDEDASNRNGYVENWTYWNGWKVEKIIVGNFSMT